MKHFFTYLLFFLFCFKIQGQELLFQEKFDNCSIPANWNLTVANNQDAGVIFGYMTNPNSNYNTIDGSCMVIFDDDILGDNQQNFRAELITPIINTVGYSSVNLGLDVSFRAYSTTFLEVYVVTEGIYIPVARFDEDNNTGNNLSDAIHLDLELAYFTNAKKIQIAIVFDDSNMYGWWAGIDNLTIIGENKGEIIIQENFDDCTFPAGWESEILRGEHDWQFGLVSNTNTSTTSMNGTCMAYFDDDGIGENVPFSTAEIRTPIFDGSQYAEFLMEFDLIYRKAADFENISIYVFDGQEYFLVNEFLEDVGGTDFNNYEKIRLDLTKFRSLQMQVVFRYEDGESWGWWVAIDNVSIFGKGDAIDICSKAISISPNQICSKISNHYAVTSGPANSCVESINHTIWYTYTADRTGILKIKNNSDFNDVISVYSGDCNNLNEIACYNKDEHGFDGEENYIDVLSGDEIYIRVAGVISQYGKIEGNSCLGISWVPTLPSKANFDKINAPGLLFPDGNCVEINTINAETELFFPNENTYARSDIWLIFNCVEDGDYKITSDVDFSESITVFDLDLSIPSEISNSNYGKNLVLKEAKIGKSYGIQIAGLFASIEGKGCIKLEKLIDQQDENDDCLSASLISNNEIVTLNNSNNEFSGIYPSCNIYSSHDSWLKFVAGSNSSMYLTANANFPFAVSIYSGTCNNLEEEWCSLGVESCAGQMQIPALSPNQTYYLQIVTDYSFKNNQSGEISIKLSDEPQQNDILALNVLVICQDGSKGALEILASGGTGNYTFQGNQSGEILLAGEEYFVLLTDSDGCEVSKKGLISCQPTNCMLTTEAVVTHLSCFEGQEGSILLNPKNAQEPIIYEWSDPNLVGENEIYLSAGSYTVTMTDANLCVHIESFDISQPTELKSTIISNDESSEGGNDGTAIVIPSGGTFPYSFSWSNGETTSDISNLSPGSYSVTISDALGCALIKNVSIAEYACATEINAEIINLKCFGGSDGQITLDNELGLITDVLWSNNSTGLSINDLVSGEYSALISLTDGCLISKYFEIISPSEINILLEETNDVICHGEANGYAKLVMSGGTGTIDLLWGDGNSTNERNDLKAGKYDIQATDANGCNSIISIQVNEPEPLTAKSTMSKNPTCSDDEDGAVCVFIDGGVMPYSFDWGDNYPALSKLENLNGGSYPLNITDNNGCSFDTIITLINPSPIVISNIITKTDENNSSLGAIDIDVTGGNGPYTFEWILDGNVVSTVEDAVALENGLYILKVADKNGCILETEILLDIVGIEVLDEDLFTFFPNPASDFIIVTIHNPINISSEYEIIDLNGRIILSGTMQFNMANKIDVRTLTSASYYFKIKSEEKYQIIPFLILK